MRFYPSESVMRAMRDVIGHRPRRLLSSVFLEQRLENDDGDEKEDMGEVN